MIGVTASSLLCTPFATSGVMATRSKMVYASWILRGSHCVAWFICNFKQEAQLMLTNPRDAFRGKSRSPNIVPFDMLGIVSSCAVVTLYLRYSTSKNVVTLKSGSQVTQDHWKWYQSIDCVWFHISVL